MRHQSHRNPSGLHLPHSLLPALSPVQPERIRPFALPARIRAPLCSPAILAHVVSGREASNQRESSHEVFFFSLCPFRQVKYFKPKLPDFRSGILLSFLHPPAPCPSPGPQGSLFPSSSHPRATAVLTRGHQAALAGAWDPLQGGLLPCGQGSVPSVLLFSANTRTERSQDQLTNRYKAKRQRDSNLEASHQKGGVRVGGRPRWQGPQMDGTKCSVTLSHGVGCSVGWRSCGHWLGWLLSTQSQPLSLIMCASSMMYLPSLYFWLLSKACSYFHPSVVLQFSQ